MAQEIKERVGAGRRHRSSYVGSFVMSVWPTRSGGPRIHGELLKLGIEIGQTTVAKGEAPAIAGLANVR